MDVTACLYCNGTQLSPVTRRIDDVEILRCGTCNVMMVGRLQADTAALYTTDYFEKSENTGFGYVNYLTLPAANLIGKYAFIRLFMRNTGVHLDLGCADGSLMEVSAGEGFETHGLEISRDAVVIAQAKGLDVQVSDLHGFPAKLPASDVISAFDLLEHTDRPGETLKAAYANLKKAGYFVFSTLSVKKTDPSEYWFNNSLEHYVYYDRPSLEYILTDTFGKHNFAFVEVNSNGATEFWGIGKKDALISTREKRLLQYIADGDFDRADPESSYWLALFYGQVSKVKVNKQIIKAFAGVWPERQLAEVKFYCAYLQGKLEQALASVKSYGRAVPAARSTYWQAVAYAEAAFGSIRQTDIIGEYDVELISLRKELQQVRDSYTKDVLGLRSELFKVRDELHTLKNSRVVGRVIKARDIVGTSARQAVPAIKSAPHKGLYKTRKAVAKVLPPPMSRAIMRGLRGAKRRLEERKRSRQIHYTLVENSRWTKGALVSVVVPYYNRADTIDDTLASLSSQTFRNFETIIVDDGSTEPESIAKIRELADDPAWKVIRQKNQGVATARNNGIASAKGKYVICLDSDDILDDTFIEKAVLILETDHDVALVTTHQDMFGVIQELFQKSPYDPLNLYRDNMVITAAAFRKHAWEVSGGYKSNIGYEDWEFWLTLAEHGFWGRLLPEALFKYRTSMQSRYVEDKDVHWNNIKTIHSLHPKYKAKIRALQASRAYKQQVTEPATAFVNAGTAHDFRQHTNGNKNILISIPWMTFGGAETLIYNFCREIKSTYNISFVTGLQSDHEWEYKFREISPDIYHLANLFDNEKLYLEFVSHYIETRNIDILHIIHNGFTFGMLPELKKRYPKLKVIVTVFNDRAPYCEQSIGFEDYVDMYTADNRLVVDKYKHRLSAGKKISLIPNGINAYEEFSLAVTDRASMRAELKLADDEVAVFFVGRLSEEKNPDVFLEVARKLTKSKNSKRSRFFMIGDGPMKPEIEKLLKEVDSERVTYLGYQSAVAKYLAAGDIFVLPSSVEGFPLSILEAMAMEVVAVASRVGGVPDIIENGVDGYVVKPGSVEEIAQAIVSLERDQTLLAGMKKLARKKIEQQFSNRVLGANYRKMYEDTLR